MAANAAVRSSMLDVGVEHDRDRALALHGRRVQVVLACRELGFGLAGRDGDGHDDPGRGRGRWLHDMRVVQAR